MKKLFLTLLVATGLTATAQVKVGTNPTTLATNANFQVEGTTTADQFIVLKNGNVGIGTTTPTQKLTIAGRGNVLGLDNQADFAAKNSSGVYETFLTPRSNDDVMYMHYGANGFNIRNNTFASTMFMTNTGNVGIGTTAPTNKLHVTSTSDPVRLEGLQSGSLTTDNVMLVSSTGIVKSVAFNATPDQSLGSIAIFPFSSIPSDYLECNGAAVSRTTYAALFAKIGTTYGAGNGTTTFNLPDLRGEFIRGWDNSRGIDATRVLGSYQSGTPVAHDDNAAFDHVTLGPISRGATGIADLWTGAFPSAAWAAPSVTPSSASSNGFISMTRPRNLAMVYAIKAIESVMVPTSTSSAIVNAAAANEPWFNVATNAGATSNTQNIYQMGNVGIGTTNPLLKFHVQRAGAGTLARFDMSDGVSGAPQLDFRTSANTNGAAFTIQSLRNSLAEDAPLAINPNGGLVGIGTTTPLELLDVSGFVGLTKRNFKANGSQLQINFRSGGSASELALPIGQIVAIDRLGSHFGPTSYDGDIAFNTIWNGTITEKMRILYNGRIGIGTAVPSSLLSVNGSADKAGGGSWGTFSDARVKKNILDYSKGLAEIMKIRPVSFEYNGRGTYKADGKVYVGVIAQEIEKVLPSTVSKIETEEFKDLRQYDSSELIYTLINAVKELKAEIELLKLKK